jgi:cellulose synthase/poly-beta-1,6-N-acetylglucosamine synthase-like glycosyltransferase
MQLFWDIVVYMNGFILAFLIAQSLIHLVQLVFAYIEVRYFRQSSPRTDPWWMLTSGVSMPISILVPAFNEAETIVQNIRSMQSLHYPEFEVIVINDGSNDSTLKEIIEGLDLRPVDRAWHMEVPCTNVRGLYGNPENCPRLLVVDKENGGKADSLNAGINLSRFPLFCAVDADSLLDHDSLLQVMRPFVEEPEEMIAVGGRLSIVNGCKVHAGQVVEIGLPKTLFPLLQSIEYIRAFLMARLAWSRLNAMLIISGAFGLFKRSAAIKVGGYSTETVGEDMEIVVKLHRHYREQSIPYQMRYVPDSVCWTQAPEGYKVLARQRRRWQRGMLQTLWKHRTMVFNPMYGRVGIVGMGYFFFMDVVAPLVELMGYILMPLSWYLGRISNEFFFAYAAITIAYGVFLSTGALLLDMLVTRTVRARDLFVLTISAIMENFGYRQWNNWWRLEGFYEFFRRRTDWGAMPRQRHSESKPPDPE